MERLEVSGVVRQLYGVVRRQKVKKIIRQFRFRYILAKLAWGGHEDIKVKFYNQVKQYGEEDTLI